MNNRPRKLAALLLTFLFVLPASPVMVNAQEASAKPAQDKPQTESKEEEELRKREETRIKKEEERKKKEAKARASEAKKYETLRELCHRSV